MFFARMSVWVFVALLALGSLVYWQWTPISGFYTDHVSKSTMSFTVTKASITPGKIVLTGEDDRRVTMTVPSARAAKAALGKLPTKVRCTKAGSSDTRAKSCAVR